MTTRSITTQVETIKNATQKASSSKAAAVAFLRQAGIIGKAVKRVKVVAPDYGKAAEWKVVGIANAKHSVFTPGSFTKLTKDIKSGGFVTKNAGISQAKAVAGKASAAKKRTSK